MGFGKFGHLTYKEVYLFQTQYLAWCRTTMEEENNTHWRLIQRLVNWSNNLKTDEIDALQRDEEGLGHRSSKGGEKTRGLASNRARPESTTSKTQAAHPTGHRDRCGEARAPGGHDPGLASQDDHQQEPEADLSHTSEDSDTEDMSSHEDVSDWAPRVEHPLLFSKAKVLGNEYEEVMMSTLDTLVNPKRVRLVEVCCSENSRLSRECERTFGPGTALRLSYWNGGDIETQKGREYVIKTILELEPDLVWISPECGPYSPLQRTNQRNEQQVLSLEEKRRHAVLQYEGSAEIVKASWKHGIHCMLEMSERCEGWKLPWFEQLSKEVPLFEGVCHGCQVNLRNDQGVLMCKGWGLRGTNGPLVEHVNLACDGRHAKAHCSGGSIVRKSKSGPLALHILRPQPHVEASS